MPLPYFKYTLSSPHNPDNGFITIAGNKVHQICDEREFYTVLGYTDRLSNSGVLPEEYVWSEYRKDNSNQSPMCLQARIMEYLLNNSLIFATNFSERFGRYIGGCLELPRQQNLNCTYCLMHPNQKEDNPYNSSGM